MKYKCMWELTIGSHWPEKALQFARIFPEGGVWKSITLEFESDGVDAWKDAMKNLEETMAGQTYHIWYWVIYKVETTK